MRRIYASLGMVGRYTPGYIPPCTTLDTPCTHRPPAPRCRTVQRYEAQGEEALGSRREYLMGGRTLGFSGSQECVSSYASALRNREAPRVRTDKDWIDLGTFKPVGPRGWRFLEKPPHFCHSRDPAGVRSMRDPACVRIIAGSRMCQNHSGIPPVVSTMRDPACCQYNAGSRTCQNDSGIPHVSER